MGIVLHQGLTPLPIIVETHCLAVSLLRQRLRDHTLMPIYVFVSWLGSLRKVNRWCLSENCTFFSGGLFLAPQILKAKNSLPVKTCNCPKNTTCSLSGACLTDNLIYTAQDHDAKTYIAMTVHELLILWYAFSKSRKPQLLSCRNYYFLSSFVSQ